MGQRIPVSTISFPEEILIKIITHLIGSVEPKYDNEFIPQRTHVDFPWNQIDHDSLYSNPRGIVALWKISKQLLQTSKFTRKIIGTHVIWQDYCLFEYMSLHPDVWENAHFMRTAYRKAKFLVLQEINKEQLKHLKRLMKV